MQPLRELALELVNQSRAAENLPPLRLAPKLTQAAQYHADDMLRRNFYAHESPEGKKPRDRFLAAGGDPWLLVAENIAKCDGCKPPLSETYVRQMHKGWMNSPDHRENILRVGLTRFGYALTLNQDGRLYAVQTFAGPGTPEATGAVLDSRPLPQQEQINAILSAFNKQRSAAGLKPLKPAPGLTFGAKALAPAPGDADFNAQTNGNIYDALRPADRKEWAALTLLAAICGGCGTTPVLADIGYFSKQWLEHPKYAKLLLSEEVTHLGFVLTANGKGKKVALGLVGTHR